MKVLLYLSEQDTFSIADVIAELDIDKQVFMRQFKSIFIFFKESHNIEIAEKVSKNSYRIINRNALKQALNFGDSKELLSYIQILNEVLPHYYLKLDKATRKRLSKKQLQTKSAYFFHNKIENPVDQGILTEVENAVVKHRKTNIEYKGKRERFFYKNMKPLRIIFMEGNLYLGCLNEMNEFQFLRIYLIKSCEVLPETFNDTHIIQEARAFIENFQTPFSKFACPLQKVILLVSKKVARHFLQKKHLSSQTEEKLPDGSLHVTYWVSSFKEIKPLVQKWLPDIHILEPVKWREYMIEDLQNYLQKAMELEDGS